MAEGEADGDGRFGCMRIAGPPASGREQSWPRREIAYISRGIYQVPVPGFRGAANCVVALSVI